MWKLPFWRRAKESSTTNSGYWRIRKEISSFSGSANESTGGLSSNYESIIVDVSWDESSRVRQRLQAEVNRFDRLWSLAKMGWLPKTWVIWYMNNSLNIREWRIVPAWLIRRKIRSCPEGFEGWAFIYKDGDVWFIDTTEEQRSERDRHLRIGGDWEGNILKSIRIKCLMIFPMLWLNNV